MLSKTKKTPIDAVIMAGGFGERMNLGHSKVLLPVKNDVLLKHCVEQSIEAGVNRISLICDSASEKSCEKYVADNSVQIYNQKKSKHEYGSTFLMLKEFLRFNAVSDRILFEYGHAPRPSSFYHTLLGIGNDIVAAQFTQSTRRDIITGIMGYFIEPPFVINTDLIIASDAKCWSEFFTASLKMSLEICLLYTSAPSEFNTEAEYRRYLDYLEHDFHTTYLSKVAHELE